MNESTKTSPSYAHMGCAKWWDHFSDRVHEVQQERLHDVRRKVDARSLNVDIGQIANERGVIQCRMGL